MRTNIPVILILLLGLLPSSSAGPITIGFISAEESASRLGPEARAAFELAKKISPAVLIRPRGNGTFVDEQDRTVSLDRFQVLWHHQGDTHELASTLYEAPSIHGLRQFASNGGGLFLSGAALSLVRSLEIESVLPRILPAGKDGYVAAIAPVAPDHPVFQGLSTRGIYLDESVGGNPRDFDIPLTDAGYPAMADFLGTGGPLKGMLLARACAEAENPLAEYELGKGRIIVLGWRLPHYSHSTNAHRANLERLTKNILTYLGDPGKWQEVDCTPREEPEPLQGIPKEQWQSLELAIRDLMETFSDRYPRGPEYLRRLQDLKRSENRLLPGRNPDAVVRNRRSELIGEIASQLEALRSEALLDNPLLNFSRLLLIQRGVNNLGLPANFHANTEIPKAGYDNQLATLSPVRPEGKLTPLFQPKGGRFIGDVDLHFSGEKMLFSMPGENGCWQIFEMNIDGSGLRELPLIHEPDVDNYDACYLPDGRIVFTSTATFAGVPCVYGASHVTNLYLLDTAGKIRQLTVDQEHNWCPAVTSSGCILYLRWEYTDLPHSNSRILFQMNPDGTNQMAYYGSNSYFPNSFFYARPVPGHPTKVAGIATGHHGTQRSGRLLILDPARGRNEAGGVVQEIPGRGKPVRPVIFDNLVDGIWPQFLHPFPLSEKYFIVCARPDPRSPWGVYLVDVFDNRILLKEIPGYALFEPVPVRRTPLPPVIPDRIDPEKKEAVVQLTDVYFGKGLEGIPRGIVKKLRLFSYHYSYRGMGGLLGSIGMDGPWDIKRILGTVPVEPDGSALFRVPANTPIAIQPLDEDGQALQLMRSWFTAMPGEVLSCIGCHERVEAAPENRGTLAARREPSEIEPWYGNVRGFSFHREVQPVLDEYCVGCHDGKPRPGSAAIPDLRGDRILSDWKTAISGHVNFTVGGKFSVSYAELHRFVRRPGIESDIRLLSPMEYHASTTELVQILRKDHHGVTLDTEAWDRLFTWIDLNAPYHGTWSEIVGEEAVQGVAARRRAMSRLFAGVDVDPEAIPEFPGAKVSRVLPSPHPPAPTGPVELPDWPFDGEEAKRRQEKAGPSTQRTIELPGGIPLELALIPAGVFVMGDPGGHADERPQARVRIEKPFWMGRFEITNEQFALFDPSHDSRVESMHGYQFGIHGYPLNKPRQPVVRVTWNRAAAFCEWLSKRTGYTFRLPTEAEWEYACRAGTDTPLWYGDLDRNFSTFANLGDAKLKEFALDTYIRVRLVENPNRYDDWVPKDERFNDGNFASALVGTYRPNPWGLHDMHGNVGEWTGTAFRPYPYREDDGRNNPSARGLRVVRGGSWYDRPQRCRSAFRLAYLPYQPVFNVGFRVVMEVQPSPPLSGVQR